MALEKFLKSIIGNEGARPFGDSKIVSPNATFNALFLIEHAMHHFLFEKITLRFVCDWACLIEKCRDEIDWEVFDRWMQKMGYTRFAGILTYLAVEHLGLEVKDSCVPIDGKYAQRVLEDMFDSKVARVSGAVSDNEARLGIVLNRYRQLRKYNKVMQRSATAELLSMVYNYLRKS